MTDIPLKPVEFRGSSKKDFLDFPADAVTDGGYQLYLVQKGEDPVDWKPMGTVGHGCYEIRIEEASNAYWSSRPAIDSSEIEHWLHRRLARKVFQDWNRNNTRVLGAIWGAFKN